MLSFLRRVFRKSSPLDILKSELYAASAASGVPVTWETAQQAVTAMACGRVIAEGLAQVPLKLFRSLPSGGSEPARNHYLYDVIASAPNSWQSSYDWRETMGIHLVFAGNAYSVINRIESARNVRAELLQLDPKDVTPRRGDQHDIRYEVRTQTGTVDTLTQAQVLHVRGPSWDTWSGIDGVKLAREAIGLAVAQEKHGARLFKNGSTPGGILTSDAPIKDEQVQKIRDAWEARHAGAENAYKTAILWGGLKWQSLGTDNDKAQFIEGRRFQVEEVCRAFRVMPIMVGYSDKTATYASAEQMFLAHVVHTMGPWYARLEQSMNRQLLTQQERADGLHFKFVPTGLLRGAHKDRAEYYRVMREIGGLNANEIRALEEMNPYEGGDEYLTPMNMAPTTPPEEP